MSFGRMGARGIANQEITPGFVMRISKSTAKYTGSTSVAIGRDTRNTSEMLAKAAEVGLLSIGVDVIQLGVVPTPAAQQYADENNTVTLQITASHNPPNYNGIKLIGTNGMVLNRDAVDKVRELTASTDIPNTEWDLIGKTSEVSNTNEKYISEICNSINRKKIEDNQPHVVLDPGHGAGSLTSPSLLRNLGCQVKTLNANQDGYFSGRDPEPKTETLGELMKLVPAIDADIGIAHDGDADRVMFVDEDGGLIDGNTIIAALADEAVTRDDVVVTALNTSQRLTDVVEDAAGSIEYTPIGNSYILSRIQELQKRGRTVPIAGEGNGGIIYPQRRLNRDGGYVAAKFLELVCDTSISTFMEPYTGYYFQRDKIPYESEKEREKILLRASKWAKSVDGDLSTLDGYRVDFDNEWVLIRPSGTEPCIRIYSEAKSPKAADELIDLAHSEIAY